MRSDLPAKWVRRGEAFVQARPLGDYVIGLRQGAGYFRLRDERGDTRSFSSAEAAAKVVSSVNASTHITAKYWR